MSRCYPYPPPGYEKKASIPDVSVPAKKEKKNKGKDKEKKSKDTLQKQKKESNGDKDREKDKDNHKERRGKDKKDKRKKEGEVNGLSHDKDLRSSKLQRSSQEAGTNHSKEENGRRRESSLLGASFATPLDRDGRGAAAAAAAAAKPSGSSLVAPTSHPPAVYIKKDQTNGKAIDPPLPSLVLSEPPGGRPPGQEAAPSIRPPSNHNHHIDSNNVSSQRPKKLPDFSISDSLLQQAPWSTVDDEDWLRPSTGQQLHTRPKAQVEGEQSSQLVWAEAVYLSSVDMYALPYVIPY